MYKHVFASCCIALFFTVPIHGQTQYYWNTTGSIIDKTNWGTNLNGTGSQPADFVTSNQVFNLQSGQNGTPSSVWTISGSGSYLNLQSGSTFTANGNNHTLTVSLANNSNYITNTSYSNLSIMSADSGSIFTVSGTNSVSILNYGTLRFNSISSQNVNRNLTLSGNLEVKGNNGTLTVANTANTTLNVLNDVSVTNLKTLNLANSSSATLNISRNFDNQGTLTSQNASAINFVGTGSGSASWGTFSTGSVSISIASGRTVNFLTGYSNVNAPITNNGTLVLSNTNPMQGTITSTGLISGTGFASNTVTINSGGSIRGDTGLGTGALTVENNLTINGSTTNGAKIVTVTNRSIASGTGTVNDPFVIDSSKIAVTGVSNFNFAANSSNRFQIEIQNGSAPLKIGETYRVTLATIDSQAKFQVSGANMGANDIISNLLFNLVSPDYTTFTNVNLSVSSSGSNLDLKFTPVPEPASVLYISIFCLFLTLLVCSKQLSFCL